MHLLQLTDPFINAIITTRILTSWPGKGAIQKLCHMLRGREAVSSSVMLTKFYLLTYIFVLC